MDDGISTELLVGAQIRTAAREGVAIVVRRRGDRQSGTILLKVNRLDGTARVLTQVRIDEELVWSPVSRTDPLPEAEAELYLEKQARFDPDCWQLEIEDREGRHWFPGRVVKL
ncbi:MAG TPA: DUF1491 family protein [Alphaproteobacteria bacterium]|nr:DUF1491 family protein [Alphaproteobacteria bacterium]